MSRYPWEEFANKFLDSMYGVYAEITWKDMNRRLRRIGLDIRKHHDAGKISTTSPKRMTPEDVRYHLSYRRGLGYTNDEYRHEVNTFVVFFDFCENSAVRTCLRKYPVLKPVDGHRRLECLSPEERRIVIDGINSVESSDDFEIVRSFAMLALFIGCGCRTKELRYLECSDLDISEWILSIIHVKGEATYGEPRMVPVPPQHRGILLRYLELRSGNCPGGKGALFPPTRGGSDYLCANSIRKVLGISLSSIGISADPRKLRRTFGQNYLDSDIDSIESVSVLMGHSSTRTTEKYYARRRNTKAIEAARSTWGCSETANPSRIESEESLKKGQPDSVDEGPEKGDGAEAGI